MTTRDEILSEASGDVSKALDLACGYYDRSRHFMSAGYMRANTSKVSRPLKEQPAAVLLPSEDSPNG